MNRQTIELNMNQKGIHARYAGSLAKVSTENRKNKESSICVPSSIMITTNVKQQQSQ